MAKEISETAAFTAATLADDLTPISKVVSRVRLQALFTSYCFDDNWIYGWDETVGVRFKAETGMRMFVDHNPFYDLVKSLSGELEIKRTGDVVTMTSGKSKWKFAAGSPDKFIAEWPDKLSCRKADAKVIINWGPEMCRIMEDLLDATDKSDKAALLTGIHIINDGNGGAVLLASDERRYLEIAPPEGSIVEVPADYVSMPPELVKVLLSLPEKGRVWATDSFWFASIGGHEVMCVNYLPEFSAGFRGKDLRKVSNAIGCGDEKEQNKCLISDDLRGAIDRAGMASSTWGMWVNLKANGRTMTMNYEQSASKVGGNEVLSWKGKFHEAGVDINLLNWLANGADCLFLETLEGKDFFAGRADGRKLAVVTSIGSEEGEDGA